MSRSTGFTERVRALIWTRDQGCCARCGQAVRDGEYELHHRRPRGVGGSSLAWVNEAGNGLILCRGCHGYVESYRETATARGFLVSMNGLAVSSQVLVDHVLHGKVFLLDDGTVSTGEGVIW